MDISYILFNTIIYGSIAFVFSAFYGYGKFLHLGIGALMIFCGYILHSLFVDGFTAVILLKAGVFIFFYFLTISLITEYFPNKQQRDLLGLVFTLGVSIFLENAISLVYSSSAISFPSGLSLNIVVLSSLAVGLSILFWYIFSSSYVGKVWGAIEEREEVIRTLGVSSRHRQYWLWLGLLCLLFFCAGIVLIDGSVKPTDSLFYMIKGIGIMILVGVAAKQYIMLGAFLYVLLEYLLFVTFDLPLLYKESSILLIILLVLLVKPSGLFVWKKRNQ